MERKSNIELMRVILFVMVVTIHVCSPFLSSNHVVGTLSWQFTNLMEGVSRISVDCFVLITGYFMCNKEVKIKQTLKNLLIPLIFYLIPYIYLYINKYGNIYVASYNLVNDLLQGKEHFYHMWYLQIILIINLLSNYLNVVIKNIDKKQYQKLLFMLLIIASILPTVCYIFDYKFVDIELFSSRLTLFITLYFIGAYTNIYFEKKHKLSKLIFVFAIAEMSVVLLTAIYNYKISPLIFVSKLRGIDLVYPFKGFIGAFYDYNNILIILASVLFLIIFLYIDFKSKFINYISKKTYGAYILHVFWIKIYSEIVDLNPYTWYDTSNYPKSILVFIIIVSVSSIISVIIIDSIYGYVSKLVKHHF